MDINGNKILITGATAGIGKVLTEAFLKLDNEIIAVGRNATRLKELAKTDARIIPFQCDISQQGELQKLVGFVKNEHPDLNVLINNAGIQFNYDFVEDSESLQKINQEIDVNFSSPLKLIALLSPVLLSHKGPAIVNVSSGLAIVPKVDAPVYCATKAAIHIFSKSLRDQLNGRIKVFEIIPPLVDTAMTAGRGKGKISPQKLVKEFIAAFKKDKYEVNISKVKLLRIINRISPYLADRIIKSGS